MQQNYKANLNFDNFKPELKLRGVKYFSKNCNVGLFEKRKINCCDIPTHVVSFLVFLTKVCGGRGGGVELPFYDILDCNYRCKNLLKRMQSFIRTSLKTSSFKYN